MDVYEFEKSLLTRFKEYTDILQWINKPFPASEISGQWAYFIELCIEPTGWQAIWKIPRVICEEMKIRYPTNVFGIVEQVLFKELKAIFHILAVEEDDDDDIKLPERQEVLLEDLWITKQQENVELNIERTAECIDQLRFFYKNIWMPWDNDNDYDLDWIKKHLESRIRFYDDLKCNKMNKTIASHIRMLLIEAHYIQERRNFLELELSDDDDDDDGDDYDFDKNNLSKNQITDLMKLHLRMAVIKNEIELLENPKMRKVYEDMQNTDENHERQHKHYFQYINTPIKSIYKINDGLLENCTRSNKEEGGESNGDDAIVYFITTLNSIKEQINLLKMTKDLIGDENCQILMLNSLQQALNNFRSKSHIILSPGEHYMKFIEQLYNGNIIGLKKNENNQAIIKSKDDDIILFSINGDFILKNLLIDCRNVRNGILIKSGLVLIENCEIIGDNISSTRKGILISGNTELILKNCIIRNFSIGISINDNLSRIILENTKISYCKIGIELLNNNNENINIKFDLNSSITNCEKYGIWYETKLLENKRKLIVKDNQNELKNIFKKLPWSGNCLFENNKKGNIIVWNINNKLLLEDSFKDIVNISKVSLNSTCESNSEDNYNTPDTSLNGKIIEVTDDSVIEIDD